MHSYLVTGHLVVLALIVVPLGALPLTRVYRWARRKKSLAAEQNQRLLFDIATLLPITMLLWNLLVYNAGHVFVTADAMADPLTFEVAVAATGEITIVLAAVAVFARLSSGILRIVNA